MKDKNVSLIAKTYASALIELSKSDSSHIAIREQLMQVLETIESADDLKLVLENSSVSAKTKKEIVEGIFKERIDDKILNFLKILIDKKRFNQLHIIISDYDEIVDKFENKRNVEVISSIELPLEIKDKITKKLEQKLNGNVIAYWSVDESLIAGLKFKFGDFIVDASVKSKLENLSKYMLR